MIAFLDNVVTYITSVSSADAYGTLSRVSFSAEPTVQTAVLTEGHEGGTSPIKTHSLQLLVRDTDIRTAVARAQALHTLFDNTWPNTSGLHGHFVAQHDVGPHDFDPANFPVFILSYRFTTAQSNL